jgi:acyl-coenzyme A synthetase/AMP-(fatty) acid ligase
MAPVTTSAAPCASAEDPERQAHASGTTGKPKGAVRGGPPDPEVLGALLMLFGYRPDDIYLTSGPLYHSGPSAFMSAGLLFGQTIVVQRRFDAEDWLRLVDRYHGRDIAGIAFDR